MVYFSNTCESSRPAECQLVSRGGNFVNRQHNCAASDKELKHDEFESSLIRSEAEVIFWLMRRSHGVRR